MSFSVYIWHHGAVEIRSMSSPPVNTREYIVPRSAQPMKFVTIFVLNAASLSLIFSSTISQSLGFPPME